MLPQRIALAEKVQLPSGDLLGTYKLLWLILNTGPSLDWKTLFHFTYLLIPSVGTNYLILCVLARFFSLFAFCFYLMLTL